MFSIPLSILIPGPYPFDAIIPGAADPDDALIYPMTTTTVDEDAKNLVVDVSIEPWIPYVGADITVKIFTVAGEARGEILLAHVLFLRIISSARN